MNNNIMSFFNLDLFEGKRLNQIFILLNKFSDRNNNLNSEQIQIILDEIENCLEKEKLSPPTEALMINSAFLSNDFGEFCEDNKNQTIAICSILICAEFIYYRDNNSYSKAIQRLLKECLFTQTFRNYLFDDITEKYIKRFINFSVENEIIPKEFKEIKLNQYNFVLVLKLLRCFYVFTDEFNIFLENVLSTEDYEYLKHFFHIFPLSKKDEENGFERSLSLEDVKKFKIDENFIFNKIITLDNMKFILDKVFSDNTNEAFVERFNRLFLNRFPSTYMDDNGDFVIKKIFFELYDYILEKFLNTELGYLQFISLYNLKINQKLGRVISEMSSFQDVGTMFKYAFFNTTGPNREFRSMYFISIFSYISIKLQNNEINREYLNYKKIKEFYFRRFIDAN